METNQTAPGAGPAPEDVQGDSTSAGQQADGAAGSSPNPMSGPDATGPGFYAWLRRLGVPRRAGWLGGVCAGVGARLGIDPIIVRGIVVVLAVLGAPFVLVYAIAWMLLPDVEGEIHLERLTRGIVDPAVVGIAVMGVIGFIPLVQGGWLGWRWWPDWQVSDPIFGFNLTWPLRVIWALLVVGAIVWFVVWLARRASAGSPVGGAARMASAPGAADSGLSATGAAHQGAPAAGPASGPAVAAFAAGSVSAGASAAAMPPAGAEPPVPAEGADAAAIADWRAQHEAWRLSHAEWKAGQAEADRAAREQAAEEARARSLEFQAQAAAARAARRASRPRASAAYVFTLLGIAVVIGAITAIWAYGAPETSAFSAAIALAAATLVLSLGMVVAALRRRRSGILATITAASLVAMLVSTAVSAFAPYGTLIGPTQSISLGYPQQLLQPVGDAYVSTGSYDGYPNDAQVITLTQGTGDTYISVDPNTSIVLDATEAGAITYTVWGADGTPSQRQFGDVDDRVLVLGDVAADDTEGASADARLVLRQNSGSVFIDVNE
ncbi:PspC domain-containing protein [Agromyces lapidis]|uniref:PspC domain-containing protein n=1 Tax=Agromyces lapidis TaxID=279574 RepID=A0ABV5SSV8_9MICO|nr:PspC domain-containing protein [Agromyces lapidis]